MHLKKEELEKFQKDMLSGEEMIAVLTHVSECDYCAAQLGELQASHQAPDYLKGQIMARTKTIDHQASAAAGETKKQLQLFLYSLRTAAAVFAAVLVLLLLPLNRMPQADEVKVSQRITDQINSKSNEVTGMINKISNLAIDGGNQE